MYPTFPGTQASRYFRWKHITYLQQRKQNLQNNEGFSQNCDGHAFMTLGFPVHCRLEYNILHITFLLLAPLPTSGGFTDLTNSINRSAQRFEGRTVS